ncbi:DUF6531 domain-containing protein [Streptomyces phaeochromogenes]|uniref:DUF6531 domain-containing protein n=1 Tax=Streptomyces phaeochromogenes TaxID=1923 RepID=UPI00224CFBCC|nr:DUF6531 domain-containing protein [Streptomyces phaeochromogenes]MCX5604436.1 DUF6531 domain-containing protein [Streptomyces phaeochromogenes]
MLDLDKDPTPGDPDRVRTLAKSLHDFADDVQDALRLVKGMADEDAVLTMVGKTADVFRDEFSGVPKNLKKLKKSYDLAGDALAAYWPKLERAQSLADKALAKGREAQADLSSAKSRLSSADSWVTRANKEADKYKDDPTGGKDVEKPDESKVRAATRDAQSAKDAHTSAQSDVTSAQSALDAAKKMAEDARQMREDAAGEAKRKLDEASDAGIQNRKWYEEVGDWFSDNWDTIVAVCKVVVAVLGIIAMIIGGPILGAIVLIAALVVLADTLNKYMKGQASLLDVAFAALDCIPGMKGLTTLGGLAKGLRGLGKVGLKGMAMGVKGLGRSARAMSRQMKKLFTCGDPIDVATGEMVMSATDVSLPGALPLLIERHHRTGTRAGRWFGPSWSSTLDQRLVLDQGGVRLMTEDGMVLQYPVPDANAEIHPVEGPRWPLEWDGSPDGVMTVHQPDVGLTLHFQSVPGCSPAELPLVKVTDRNHHTIGVSYGPDGLPTRLDHSGGCLIGITCEAGRITALSLLNAPGTPTLMRYGYDERGDLTEIYNSSGRPLRLAYDGKRRITGWADRNDTWYHYEYDSAGRCVRTRGLDGILDYAYSYDVDANVTSVVNSLGHTSIYEFNEAFQLIAETDPLGHTTTRTWDRYDNLQSIADPLGNTTVYTYDSDGRPECVIYPDGSRSAAEYDSVGLPETVIGPDESEWRFRYDARGNRISATDPAGAVTSTRFDDWGNPSEVIDALGGARRMEWNAAGLPVVTTDPLGATTTYERDAFGRVAAIHDPSGGVTRLGWTVEGLPAWRQLPDGGRETWRYDGEGNTVEHRDPTGGVTRFTIGPFDLTAGRTGPDNAEYRFAYDTELRLTSVSNAQGRTWSYTYDAAGRLTQEVDFDGRRLRYTYDAASRVIERTNGQGQSVRYVRDSRGNVTEQRGTADVTTFAYDSADRLLSARNSSASISFTRDALGRVVAETCNGATVASSHDLLGNRTERRTPSGVTSMWTYDAGLRPILLRSVGQSLTFGYDAAGRETRRTLNSSEILAMSWSPGHQMVEQTLLSGEPVPAVLRRRSFDYRADGHLQQIRDSSAGERRFSLDSAGRITGVTGSDWNERYAYDGDGNVTSAQWTSSHPEEAPTRGDRVMNGSRLVRAGRVQYEHDEQGRVTRQTRKLLSGGRRTWTYAWDEEDRLTGTVTPEGRRWSYLYDPLGRRVAKELTDGSGNVVERTEFTWDGTRLAEQRRTACAEGIDAAREWNITTWEWAPRSHRVVSQVERRLLVDEMTQEEVDERFHAIVTDLAGSPTELVTADGVIELDSRRTIWGASGESGTSATCPLRFPGQYYDAETGLHYNCSRYYDPQTARYLSPDPLGLDPAPNHFAYVANPLSWVDPLGLTPCTLYHYTTEEGLKGILESKQLFHATGPVHARFGDGQYFTDIAPDVVKSLKKADLDPRDAGRGGISRYQLVGRLFGRPTKWGLGKTTHYVAIDVTGLEIKQGRPWVFLHPNDGPLDISDRIVRHGKTPF